MVGTTTVVINILPFREGLVRLLVVQIFVFQRPPVGNQQAMRVILCPWHILQFTDSDDGSAEVSTATLDELGTIVLKLSGMLIQLDGVTFDRTYGTAGDDIRVEAVLFHRLLLLHGRAVSHVHRLSECPLDIVIVGWEIEEVLMKELDMCLSLHHKVSLLQATFGKKWDITIEDINLTAFLTDEPGTLIDCEDADGRTADNGKNNRCQG